MLVSTNTSWLRVTPASTNTFCFKLIFEFDHTWNRYCTVSYPRTYKLKFRKTYLVFHLAFIGLMQYEVNRSIAMLWNLVLVRATGLYWQTIDLFPWMLWVWIQLEVDRNILSFKHESEKLLIGNKWRPNWFFFILAIPRYSNRGSLVSEMTNCVTTTLPSNCFPKPWRYSSSQRWHG